MCGGDDGQWAEIRTPKSTTTRVARRDVDACRHGHVLIVQQTPRCTLVTP